MFNFKHILKTPSFLVIFFIFLSLFASAQAIAQTTYTLKGIVVNDQFVAISNVSVFDLNTKQSVLTNQNGEFKFYNIGKGSITIKFSIEGYETTTKTILVKKDLSNLTIQLNKSPLVLEEVMVISTKKEENLQNVNSSITVLSTKQITENRILNLKDISGWSPNLNLANSGDNRNVTSIRGITTTSYDPAVAVYIDGVNQFGMDTYISGLLDVERIEILKGPQGTLYGRNAMGGVINIVTKSPSNTTKGFVEAGIANFNQNRYSFGVSHPLIENKLYLSVSGLHTNSDGFYKNEFNNSAFDKQNSYLGNYYLKYLAGPKLTITLNMKHFSVSNNGIFPLVADANSALSNPFKVNVNAISNAVDRNLNSSLAINYAATNFDFTSQSSYQSNYRYYKKHLDGDFSPFDAISIFNNYGKDWNKVEVFTQDFSFSSSKAKQKPLQWLVGSYLYLQKNPVKQAVHFGEDAMMAGADFTNFTILNTNVSNSKGAALYGQLDYAINSKLHLTGGLRYDGERKSLSIKGKFGMDGQPMITTRTDTSKTVNYHALSPKFAVGYTIDPQSTLFASYNRGFRTGGITQLSSDPSQPALNSFKPEYSNNLEIGSKNMLFNKRLRLNMSAFYTLVTDAQIPILVLPDALTYTQNAGELLSKGFEIEMGTSEWKGLSITNGFGYTDAKYTKVKANSNQNDLNLVNKKQIFTPNMTNLMALKYAIKLNKLKNIKLTTIGEWKYVGDQFFDFANAIKQESFHIYNTRLILSTKHWELSGWANNLLNKIYIDYAYEFGATHLGNPRSFGGALKIMF